tara:strand:+ start:203 stop:1174 length:972 start_codon:yes stop_codon:yes gene_type:complete
MKAITLTDLGVKLANISKPKPGDGKVLIKVKACGLNRSDLLETQGQSFGHLGRDNKVLGGEFSGEVVELGENVKNLGVGDRVMCRGGSGWAEYAIADHRRTLKIGTENISWEQAACVQGALQTMHDAIVTNGRFKKGQSVLIQGASSGAGLMGLQIAQSLGAKLVIGTSRQSNKRERLSEFGADISLDSGTDQWLDETLKRTDNKGVDIVIDLLSGNYVSKNMSATKVHGYIINVGRLAGMEASFDFNLHAAKRLHYIGTTGRTRSIEEHMQVARKANDELWELVKDNQISSPIDRVYPIDNAEEALDRMNSDSHFGKIILKL